MKRSRFWFTVRDKIETETFSRFLRRHIEEAKSIVGLIIWVFDCYPERIRISFFDPNFLHIYDLFHVSMSVYMLSKICLNT